MFYFGRGNRILMDYLVNNAGKGFVTSNKATNNVNGTSAFSSGGDNCSGFRRNGISTFMAFMDRDGGGTMKA